MVHKGKKAYLKNFKKSNDAEYGEPTAASKKSMSNMKASKKAKVIVRNLPFKNLCEKTVEEFFKEYGDIEEVKLLKTNDGKFVGCGFVQFKKVSGAAKAIRHANQKKMSGRSIVVDWALPKKTFLEKVQKLNQDLKQKVKVQVSSGDEDLEFEIDKKPNVWNRENDHDNATSDYSVESSDSETSHRVNSKVDSDDFHEDDDDDDDDDEDDDDDDDGDDHYHYYNRTDESTDNKKNISNKQRRNSVAVEDAEDGKTVFVRNIPFSATNDEFRSCVNAYGPVEYALICIDKLTEHSKGTGFVKFKDPESASKCVKDSTKMYLHNNPLSVTMALSKTNLESKKTSKKVVKDSRNLYLIREGVVIAGSKAAAGVSAGDMAKRLQLEQWKNQILKNLNMFVSRTRLVIHNLPPFYNDNKLRSLFLKYSSPKAIIKEAKVMYDKKTLDSTGKGASKEVGFVSFTNHEDALQALRNINNNPNIFTPKKRPIVAFSIENRTVINSKVKRLEKSRAKLGINDEKPDKLSKLNRKQRRFIRRREKFIQMRRDAVKLKEKQSVESPSIEKTDEVINEKKRKNLEEAKPKKKCKNNESTEINEDVRNQFTGVISESGKKVKLRSRFRLKNQANIHSQFLKTERRKRREKERKKMSFRKPAKEKKGKSKLIDDTTLSKLLKKHRESIQQASIVKKWYDK